MKTGEGKTLVATLPVYLNALEGKGVHVVTVNDYLAQRDASWMGELYNFLGLTTGVIINDASFIYDPDYDNETHDDEKMRKLRPVGRKEAYSADITDRKSTRLNSSHCSISYAVFCLKKKINLKVLW